MKMVLFLGRLPKFLGAKHSNRYLLIYYDIYIYWLSQIYCISFKCCTQNTGFCSYDIALIVEPFPAVTIRDWPNTDE